MLIATYPTPTAMPGTQPFDPGQALLGQQNYNACYMASLPPAVVAFMALPYNEFDASYKPGMNTRTTPAAIAAISSLVNVDLQIMVWGWDPTMTMVVRINEGFTWTASYGQAAPPVGPGINGTPLGLPSYNPSAPPAGSIIMPKWDSQGYLIPPAPYVAPVPPTPPTPTPMQVGSFQFAAVNPLDGNQYEFLYGVVSGTSPKVGQQVIYNGNVYELVNFPDEDPMAAGVLMTLWKYVSAAPATAPATATAAATQAS